MNRITAILLVFAMIGLLLITIVTEDAERFRQFQVQHVAILHLATVLVLAWAMLFYCGFAALHAVQRIASPVDRSKWMLLTIVFNIFGSCLYYCTTYQTFRNAGLGKLMSPKELNRNKAEQGDSGDSLPADSSQAD